MKALRVAVLLLIASAVAPALAQAPSQGRVVSACGTPGITYTVGAFGPVTVDTTGKICDSGGSVTQGTSPWIVGGAGTAGSAATGVATVQGIASMTPFLVNPGTAANWNTSWAGGVLGAMANYGTSPGAVLVPGVNAFVTSLPAVAGGGTAGSAATGVVTVQGIASMVPFLINPGTSANWAIGTVAAPSTNVVTVANPAADPCQTQAQLDIPITIPTATTTNILTGTSALADGCYGAISGMPTTMRLSSWIR